MPRIAGVATAAPEYILSQEKIKTFAKAIFGEEGSFLRLLPVFDNSLIESRRFVADLDWFSLSHDFTETNDLYIKSALKLMEDAVLALAEQCQVRTTDFDAVFFVSTTGLSTPSMDARLFNRIPLNPHIKRIPIWGLGCAGGASALSRAAEYLRAFPKHRALILAVELCGLAFQKEDRSKGNVVATALFADGAAACLLVGDEVEIQGRFAQPSVMGSLSTIYRDTLEVMSWRATSGGFRVGLSRDIPAIVSSLVKNNIEEFLAMHELSLESISHFIMHPGGIKVLQAYRDILEVPMQKLEHSLGVLRDYGNMSSVTVYFILKRFLESTESASREYGLLSALGPGFSSELVLLQWN